MMKRTRPSTTIQRVRHSSTSRLTTVPVHVLLAPFLAVPATAYGLEKISTAKELYFNLYLKSMDPNNFI